MKKIYLLASIACMSLGAQAQIHSTNFDNKVDNGFLTKTVFTVNQSGSSLIIKSAGHDQWDGVKYQFNNGEVATPISITKNDTIYVRVKATYEGSVKPRLGFGLSDVNGAGPNNALYNGGNTATLSNEWQIFKFTVKNLNMEWGAPNDPNLGKDMDSTQVAYLNFSPNTGFIDQENTNSEGDTIKSAFAGTIYIDYVSVGSSISNGKWLDAVTTFEQTFDTDVTADITSAESFVVSSGNGELSIVSEGHDQWDVIEYTLKDNVIDLTSNPMIEFTANATSTGGNFGVMVVAENELGQRIETAGAYKIQSLTANSSTVQVKFESFMNSEGAVIDAKRIAKLVILINPGFALYPQKNNLDQSVTTAFEGTIKIENIKLGEAVVANGLTSTKFNSLSLYPNPATYTLSVDQTLVGGNYTIVSSTGAVMQSGIVESTVSVDGLKDGLYHIQVSNNGNVYSNSFLKK